MISFKDNSGRVWLCRVDVAAIRRVRALAGIDLAAAVSIDTQGNADTSVLHQLARDPVLLVDTLYAVLKPQADKLALDTEQFAAAFDGETIETAGAALLQGIVEFYPLARRRLLDKILTKAREQEKAAQRQIEQMETSGELDKILNQALSSASLPPAPQS